MRVLILALVLLTLSPVAARDSNADKIDAIFAPYARTDAPGCVVGVYRSGEIAFTGAYGMADVALRVPLRDTTALSLASATKTFTALAVLLLEADGKIRLGDDIRRYVPEVPDFGKPITILDLLQHTSGLRDYWNLFNMAGWRSSDVETQDDVLWLVRRQRSLNHPTGAEFLYTNTGYILLAVMVERVSGTPFRRFASDRIFEPLGMPDSDVKTEMGQLVRGVATGYWGHDPSSLRLATRPTAFAGNGGVFSSVRDLARWDANFDNPKVGTRAMLDSMTVPGEVNGTAFGYGMGWFIGTHRGHRMISHAGSDPGYKAHFMRFPDDRLSVAVLCNAFDIAPTPLALQVADLYLTDKTTPVKDEEGGAAEIPTPNMAGLYWHAATGGLKRVVIEDGQLKLDAGEGLYLLTSQGHGSYRLKAAPRKYVLTFVKDKLEVDVEGSPVHTYEKVPETKAGPLSELAGTYRSEELDVDWTIVLRDGQLVLERRRMGTDPLERLFGDVFQSEAGYVIEFKRGGKGSPAALEVITERVRRLRFTRIGSTVTMQR